MRNRIFTLILLFSAVLLSACNGAAPISPGVDECTVSTQSTDCIDPTKPVCKDDGSGKMTCQAECTVATQSTDCPAAKPVCKDDGTGKMTCQAKPSSGDKCTDNSGCSGATPICDTSASPKACRAAKSVDECKTLNPNPGVCEKVTYDATSGCGVAEKAASGTTTDGCCPAGADHTTDADCSATDECTVATQSTDCTDPAKPVCKADGTGKMTCQAKPSSGDECTVATQTTDCTDPAKPACKDDGTGKMTCQAECTVATQSTDCTDPAKPVCKDAGGGKMTCQAECTVATQSTDCPATKPLCKDDGTGKMTCQAPAGDSDCNTLVPKDNKMCVSYTFNSSTKTCDKGTLSAQSSTTKDGCCLDGRYSDTDADCPVKCNNSNDCTDPVKPICLEDANHTKVCRAPLKVKLGAPCDSDGVCGEGGTCFDEAGDGYPGGYCMILLANNSCSTDSKICSTNIGVLGKTSACLPLSSLSSTAMACSQGCTNDKDCRSGYKCNSSGDYTCIPNVVMFAAGKAGKGCNIADDCKDSQYPDDRIECKKAPAGDGDTWKSGYCTADCSADPGVCPTGTTCADVDGQKRCLLNCNPQSNSSNMYTDGYLRPAYMCVELPGGDPNKGVYVSKKGVGAPCDSTLGTMGGRDSQIDGTCQIDYDCKEGADFLGGYCVSTANSCPDGSAHFDGSSECYKTCSTVSDTPTDCRSGYKCIAGTGSSTGTNFCLNAAPSATSGGAGGGAGTKEFGQSCTDDTDCKAGTGMVCYKESNKSFCTIIAPHGSNDVRKDCYAGKGKYYTARSGKFGNHSTNQMHTVCFPKATGTSDCKAPLSAYEPSWGTCSD